jgi:hypothetical protein
MRRKLGGTLRSWGCIWCQSVANVAAGAVPAVLVVLVGVCVVSGGCAGYRTVWSSESRSPDGKIVASAQSIVINEGLSIVASIQTNVYLRLAGGSPRRMMILQLADATADPVNTGVEINWLTPTHLELTVRGNQSIVFQAVKSDGIEISVRDLSKAAIEGQNATRSLTPPGAPPFAYHKTAPRSGE